jgi:hypothetical protein
LAPTAHTGEWDAGLKAKFDALSIDSQAIIDTAIRELVDHEVAWEKTTTRAGLGVELRAKVDQQVTESDTDAKAWDRAKAYAGLSDESKRPVVAMINALPTVRREAKEDRFFVGSLFSGLVLGAVPAAILMAREDAFNDSVAAAVQSLLPFGVALAVLWFAVGKAIDLTLQRARTQADRAQKSIFEGLLNKAKPFAEASLAGMAIGYSIVVLAASWPWVALAVVATLLLLGTWLMVATKSWDSGFVLVALVLPLALAAGMVGTSLTYAPKDDSVTYTCTSEPDTKATPPVAASFTCSTQ